jgi:hypothetical protein
MGIGLGTLVVIVAVLVGSTVALHTGSTPLPNRSEERHA